MKKSGGVRVINSPNVQLKKILGCLNQLFKIVANVHHCATGFVANKSVVDNAKKHVGKNYVYNIDLKDFFHSFDRNRVKMGLWKSLYDLNPEKENISFLLACLVTHSIEVDGEEKYVLPQGSPSSPIITNILCHKLDVRLNGLAKRFRVSYSRYADDITFSSDVNVFNKSSFLKELHRIIIQDQKLSINEAKTRLQKNGYKKEVTGLIVNEKVNVTRHYIKQLRMWIYYIEKYGFKKADSIFRKDYVEEKSHVKYRFNSMSHVIQGKLDYLKMVKGEDDPTYLKLSSRFTLLQRKNNSKKNTITIADKLNDFVNSDFNFELL